MNVKTRSQKDGIIRIDDDLAEEVREIAHKTGMSIGRVAAKLLRYAINHAELRECSHYELYFDMGGNENGYQEAE